jgi:hypothetical protein
MKMVLWPLHRDLTQSAEGTNELLPIVGEANPLRLVMLFCLEKAGCPTGIFPRAFSDIPRSCDGTASSVETTEGALELLVDCVGVGT